MKRSALARKMEYLDAIDADQEHYKVEFENDSVRVIRIKYGPNEKSVMHDHGNGAVVFLTDHRAKFTYPDGKTEILTAKAGDVKWMDAFRHNPENLNDSTMELIYVELKK